VADPTEYEDLDALLTSAGWTRFKSYIAEQWGTPQAGGGIRFQQAVNQASRNETDANALAQLRQVVVAQREIQGLIIAFEGQRERVKPLEPRQEMALSRRGGL
jgi:hypothetical protein